MKSKRRPRPGRTALARFTAEKAEDPARVFVGFRSPPALKAELERAAAANGRSLSTEAQVRLEQSFRGEADLYEALRLAFGSQGAELLLLLGRAIRSAPFIAGGGLSPDDDWLADPGACVAAARQISLLIEAVLQPEEEKAPPALVAQADDLARRLLLGLGDPAAPDTPLAAWAARSREFLGPAAAARIAAWREAYLARR